MRHRTAEDWAGNGVPWQTERHLKSKYANDSSINKSRSWKDLGFFHNLRKEFKSAGPYLEQFWIFDMIQHGKEGIKQVELDQLST